MQEQEVFKAAKGQILEGLTAKLDPEKEFAAVFADGYVLLGKTENMRAGLLALQQKVADVKDLQHSAEERSAPIVTYANDEARLNNFILTLLKLQGRRLSSDEVANL